MKQYKEMTGAAIDRITKEEIQFQQLENVVATMAIAGMPINTSAKQVLQQYQNGDLTAKQVVEIFLRNIE